MFKRIMVAIDHSTPAQQALKAAIAMAGLFDAALCIINVMTDPDSQQPDRQQLLIAAATAANQLTQVETRLLEADEFYGAHGISEVIVAAANEWQADLVVVGSGNRHGLERFISGAVEDEVVASVNASVLVIHPDVN